MTTPRFTCKYCGSSIGSFEIEFDEWKHKNLLECVGVLKRETQILNKEIDQLERINQELWNDAFAIDESVR